MSITNGYATLNDARLALGFDGDKGSEWNRWIERQIQAISRWIDDATSKRFYATTETRYYTPENRDKCSVDDLLSVTALKTDHDSDLDYDYTWEATDYLLMPRNALADGWPYHWIRRHPSGDYYFPVNGGPMILSVELEGSFGFCATGSQPDAITDACVLAVEQLFMRKDAIFGVTGPVGLSYDAKVMLRGDPHIMGLLAPYITHI